MKWIMSVAAGLAIGYFVYQMIISSKNGESRTTGRIHKSTKDKKIAGVCGGIAEYLNADPTIIRLVFAMLVLGWGSGVLAYIVCALVLPEGE
jgi:phage shock protein PspC (stress-responsive transcriptional regulator)